MFCAVALLSFYAISGIVFLSQVFWAQELTADSVKNEKQLVLFTGQPERIYALREILAYGYAGTVFLSGVNPQVSVEDILPDGIGFADIDMDYASQTTKENAVNTAIWLGYEEEMRPFVFITNRYHMPRSLLLLKAEGLEDFAIPYPVSGGFKPVRWWREYHKWLWVNIDFYAHLSEIIGKIGLDRAS